MASETRKANRKRKPDRTEVLHAYLKTAIAVVIIVAVIAVIWLIVKPFRLRAEKARLEAASSESETLEITVDPEADDGSGQAGRARIPDGMSVQFDTPGWQHDDRGWWYASDEQTFYVNGWFTVDQKQYHFSSSGYMDTGWTPIGGRGCYFDEHGVYDESADNTHLIALTFDDGPGEHTTELLNMLEENDAKATFFMVGQMVEEYGAETIPQMVRMGCQLGNHSYDHSDMTTLSVSAALQQFQNTDELIANYSGGSPASVIRFPYGSFNDAIESKIDKPSIYWNFDTVDWTGPEPAQMAQNVVDNVEGGDIVLMHDIHDNTISAVKIMLPKLREAGYQMVTISELAAARGYQLESGVTYYGFSDSDIAHDSVSDKAAQSAEGDADTDTEVNEADPDIDTNAADTGVDTDAADADETQTEDYDTVQDEDTDSDAAQDAYAGDLADSEQE